MPKLTRLVVSLAAMSSAALAVSDTTYSTQSSWQAATLKFSTDTFGGIAPIGGFTLFNGSATANATYTGSGNYLYVVDPNYLPSYYKWSDGNPTLLGGLDGTITAAPTLSTTSIGLYLSSIQGYASPITVTLSDGSTFTVQTDNYPNLAFFGVTSLAPIQWITFTAANGYPELHDVSYGTAAPEPMGITALSLSLLSLIWLRRKD